MTLDEALAVLLDVHCGDLWREPDWAVRIGAAPDCWLQPIARYIEAWETVREHRLRCESR